MPFWIAKARVTEGSCAPRWLHRGYCVEIKIGSEQIEALIKYPSKKFDQQMSTWQMTKTPITTPSDKNGETGKIPKAKVTTSKSKSQSLPLPERTAVVVLGMHRSGTSAMAGVLHLIGCDAPATPMEASVSNKKGYFESEPIYKFHSTLLDSTGSQWDDWSPITSDWQDSPSARTFLKQAAALIHQEFGASRLFVLKDPRICRLVPFWEQALAACEVVPRFVLTHRHPVEVAASLFKRDKIDHVLGMLIWLRHVLDAEKSTRGKPRCFVSYEGLLSDWDKTVQVIQEKVDLPIAPITVKTTKKVEAFLDAGLRHNVEAAQLVLENAEHSDWVRDTYAILEKWTAGTEDKKDYKVLDATRRALANAAMVLAPTLRANSEAILKLETRQIELDTRHTAREKKLDTLTRDYEALGKNQSGIVAARNRIIADRNALRETNAEAQQNLTALRADLSRAESALHALQIDQTKRRRIFAEREASLIQNLHANKRAAHAELTDLRVEKDAAKAALKTIHNSLLWRVTRPLRWTVKLIWR